MTNVDDDSDDTILLESEESNSEDGAVNAGSSTSSGGATFVEPSASSEGATFAEPSTSSRVCPMCLCLPTNAVLSNRQLYLRTLRHTAFPREDSE